METLGRSSIKTYLSTGWEAKNASNYLVRHGNGYAVRTFHELASAVAQLAFYNRDHVLLFRGQNDDYRNSKKNTSIQPGIFRKPKPSARSWAGILEQRYERLARAESRLVANWGNLPDKQRIERHRTLRWAVLQHYEICRTPLLDVTQSLRVAATFALKDDGEQPRYVYVLAVPQISGAITASAEAELQILRLASICPPTATRPHFQEGYLLGHYPELTTADEKQRYALYEVDFARRLLCKFKIEDRDTFWGDDFSPVNEGALFPNDHDPLFELAQNLKSSL